jgi:hypothetical protein
MDLVSPYWRQADGSQGLARRHIIRGLVLPENISDNFLSENILETITPASTAEMLGRPAGPQLKDLQNRLQRQIQKTFVEIKAEVHSRLVFGIGCISLIMIGIGLGIIKKGGHLLTAFGISVMPAAALIVCIMMGKNVTKNPNAQAGSGIFLMWASLVVLTILALEIHRRLLKN